LSNQFQILVATGRPALEPFFAAMARRSADGVSTTIVGLGPNALARASRAVMTASVAVVDASIDPKAAVDTCAELLTGRPDLPISVLFCCPHSATPPQMRAFIALGIGSFLDLQLSAEQALGALRAVARGEDVVRLQLTGASSNALFSGDGIAEQLGEEELVLLRLVARGLTDNEIGVAMFLSRHTVKHRIERLRRRVDARNRVQLAAWAARLEPLPGPGRKPASV
jgi:DNA-binding NarL/FixJ family response regulator